MRCDVVALLILISVGHAVIAGGATQFPTPCEKRETTLPTDLQLFRRTVSLLRRDLGWHHLVMRKSELNKVCDWLRYKTRSGHMVSAVDTVHKEKTAVRVSTLMGEPMNYYFYRATVCIVRCRRWELCRSICMSQARRVNKRITHYWYSEETIMKDQFRRPRKHWLKGINGPPLFTVRSRAIMLDLHFSCTNRQLVHFLLKKLDVNITIFYMNMHWYARDLPILTTLIDVVLSSLQNIYEYGKFSPPLTFRTQKAAGFKNFNCPLIPCAARAGFMFLWHASP